jgi:hypothetical protein
MNNSINAALEGLTEIFTATGEVLEEWHGTANLQFPVLMGMLAVRMNWDAKQVRENDPLVRYYVRKHPDWYVTRGAHGGMMRLADKQKKDATRTAKTSLKNQMRQEIENRVANESDDS